MSTPDNSQITLHPGGGFTVTGKDAMNLMRALTLKQGLSLYAKSGILLTRGATPMVLLTMATEYTGKKYKRGQYDLAAKDVAIWCDTMKAALPVNHS